MASVNLIKRVLGVCHAAGLTPFIWGHRGLGKSSLVSQYAKENGFGFIDLRCSQMEASDIRGLPDTSKDAEGNVTTVFRPPADMPIGDMSDDDVTEALAESLGIDSKLHPVKMSAAIAQKIDSKDLNVRRRYEAALTSLQPRYQRGVLFLDEVNRGADDVLQAIFQLILDRRVGQYVLPPGWMVVAAGNYMEGYRVGGFDDPAFLNRFCHVDLSGGESTVEEWVNYMSASHGGDAASVIEFASQNVKHLDGDVKGERGFTVQPSRRSWEQVVRADKVMRDTNVDEGTRIEILAGLIGRELALSYTRYDCPVKPKELLQDGVKRHSSALSKLSRNQMTGLMWGLVSFCKTKMEDDKTATVCLDFAEYMLQHVKDKDVIVAFCRALVAQGSNDHHDKTRLATISNPKLAEMLAKWASKSPDHKKTFIDRLSERPALQDILSKAAWGSDKDEKKK